MCKAAYIRTVQILLGRLQNKKYLAAMIQEALPHMWVLTGQSKKFTESKVTPGTASLKQIPHYLGGQRLNNRI